MSRSSADALTKLFEEREIRAILFDKDGTLLDYHKSWGPLNEKAASLAARHNPELTQTLLKVGGYDSQTRMTLADSLLAASNTQEIAQAWVKAGSPLSIMELTEALDALFTQAADHSVPVTDLAALFAHLKNIGLKLGIASSDSEQAIERFAKGVSIAPFLDFIAGYNSGHGVKPSAGMLNAFSRRTGISSQHIAVIGDNTHDMAMAASGNAGLKVAVLTGTGTTTSLSNCSDICIDDISLLTHITARH